jgi:anti-anti-sigma factor
MSEYSSMTVLAHTDTIYPLPVTVTVAVAGEFDLATADALRDGLLDVLDDQNPAVLEVDLAGITFMDCAGLSALVAVRNVAVQTGRRLRIVHPQPIVHRVLAATGLLTLLAGATD